MAINIFIHQFNQCISFKYHVYDKKIYMTASYIERVMGIYAIFNNISVLPMICAIFPFNFYTQ